MENRLPAALACACWAVAAGVQLIRTHDVFETLRAVRMLEAIKVYNDYWKTHTKPSGEEEEMTAEGKSNQERERELKREQEPTKVVRLSAVSCTPSFTLSFTPFFTPLLTSIFTPLRLS